MEKVDYIGAKQYILGRLARELADDLYYHGLMHTYADVLPAAEWLAKQEGFDDEPLLLLKTAALYHDSGYIVEYFRNEPIGVQLAAETLPDFGYSPGQIEMIGDIIMATQLPQEPENLLQQIMCDADLDSLGRQDFFIVSQRLRLELQCYGVKDSLRVWYERQLQFLNNHRYFTKSANQLRGESKRANIQEIMQLLNS